MKILAVDWQATNTDYLMKRVLTGQTYTTLLFVGLEIINIKKKSDMTNIFFVCFKN